MSGFCTVPPKPEARPRIYAYSIADAAHHGQFKVGQTTRDVKQRVAEQLKTAAIQMGRDAAGNIKPSNEWLHTVNWDLVVFDEYHFGAWRDTAKELFEGEDDAVAKKEAKLEYAGELAGINEDLTVLSNQETDFLPITTRAYLYLSGTPFKALATGEFIEEQIFNWTYTDEQRAKAAFAATHPAKRNPYAALPQMRLLTYQMPDELLAIASGGEFDEFDLNSFFDAKGTGVGAEFTH